MKLSEYKNDFYTFTGKLSDINIQIAFAGIALIWIFKKTDVNNTILSSELVLPAILLAISLGIVVFWLLKKTLLSIIEIQFGLKSFMEENKKVKIPMMFIKGPNSEMLPTSVPYWK